METDVTNLLWDEYLRQQEGSQPICWLWCFYIICLSSLRRRLKLEFHSYNSISFTIMKMMKLSEQRNGSFMPSSGLRYQPSYQQARLSPEWRSHLYNKEASLNNWDLKQYDFMNSSESALEKVRTKLTGLGWLWWLFYLCELAFWALQIELYFKKDKTNKTELHTITNKCVLKLMLFWNIELLESHIQVIHKIKHFINCLTLKLTQPVRKWCMIEISFKGRVQS